MNNTTYDWNKPLLPGTVICSSYGTFDDKQRVGIFVVLYDEQNDNYVLDNKNVVALKLSTKGTCVSNYSVQIDMKLNNFLDDDCIACCSKIHILHKKQQVYKILGILHPATYHKIYKMYMKFSNEINNQLIANL